MTSAAECFALLDDASGADPHGAASRLYTGYAGALHCTDAGQWPQMLAHMQSALRQGQYAVSLLSYELGAHLQAIAPRAVEGEGAGEDDGELAQVLLFNRCEHLSAPEVTAWLAARIDPQAPPAGIADIGANVDPAQFGAALDDIHALIEAGDTYQVNYTYRLRFDAFGTPLALYARLRARQPVPYGALVQLPDGAAVLSLSPELFVRHLGGELLTRPMKGTARAAPDDAPDAAADNARRAQALAADSKNRAENVMIVDLLRNDLSQVAVTGSVKVPALFQVQRYSSVLQMTSTVSATLRGDATLPEIFSALYPCGSITGAPKRRTMQIIRALEAAPRGIYTGAIGWFDPPGAGAAIGDFCLSVPIRTLALQAPAHGVRRGELGVGAGIVFDSQAGDEYAECQLKASFLTGLPNDFAIFETMYADADGVRHLALHLARMSASARYFGFPFARARAEQAIVACAGPTRMRLALDRHGQFSVACGAVSALAEPVGLLLAPEPTDADDLFLRHKTSIRSAYDAAWRAAEQAGGFDTLFFNARGELTEGGRSNVFVRIDGAWLTPPLACGVLPGIMRSVLLSGSAEADSPVHGANERVITRAMFARADQIIVCNALRGALTARLLGAA
jgi:para-aminobenzoate synthetase/4-amino-4-deoxychorismate lyase